MLFGRRNMVRKMQIINNLTESQFITSRSAYRKFTGLTLIELLYLHVLAFRILASDEGTRPWAIAYAKKSKQWYGFSEWHQNANDLYYVIHAVINYEDEDLDFKDATRHTLARASFDEDKFLDILKAISSDNGVSDVYYRRFLLHIDRDLGVVSSTLRSIRRLVMNWPDIGRVEKQLCITRLLQYMREHCNTSDLTMKIKEYARDHKLELAVGDGKKSPTLSHYIKYSLREESEPVLEDDGGGEATTSADIAPMVVPLGNKRKVHKR